MRIRRAHGYVALGCAVLLALTSFLLLARAGAPAIALGVNVADAPDQAAPLQGYVTLSGRAPAIVMWYQAWNEPLYYSNQMRNVAAIGAIPMISWSPAISGAGIPLTQIVAGRDDAYLKRAAAAAVAWRKPLYIRFGYEMNLTTSPFRPSHRGDTARSFIAAWRHVVSLFRRRGARNVEWVWSPNVDCHGRCPFRAFYPGDAWVDWLGLDGYNYAAADGVPWMSFDELFGPSYATLERMSTKPVMIAETASTGQGGDKALWIAQAAVALATHFPRVHALVWFDRDGTPDWRVNSTVPSLLAWQQVVGSTTPEVLRRASRAPRSAPPRP